MPELCNLLVGDVLMDGMQPIEVHYLGGRLRDFVYSLASIEPARRHLVCKLVFHQGVDFRNAGEYDMLRPVFPLLTSVFFLGRVISLPKDADYGEYSVHIGLFPTKRTEWIDCCGGNARWTCPPSNNNEMLLENLGIDFGKATKWADRRSCQISNCQTAENFVNSVNWGRILSGDGGIQVDPDLLELVRENLSVDPEPAFGTLLLKRLLVGGAMADISRTDVLCLPSFPFGTDDECFDRADPLYGADSFFGIDDPEPGVWRNDVVPWSVGHFSDTGAAIPISYADSVDALSFLAKFWPKANSSESLEKYAPDSFMKGLVRFLDVCPAVCGWSLDGTRQISWCDIAEQLYANSKLAWLSDAAGRIAAEYLCRCGRTSGVFFASPSSADFAAAVTSWTALNEVADPECLQDFVGPFGITVSGESGSESLAIKGSPVELDDRPFLVTVLVERPCWSMEVVGGDYVGVKALGLGALMKVILDVAPDFARDEFARRALFDLVLRNLGLNVIRQPEIVDTMSAYWSRVCGSLPLDTAN
jgi:hypothetical protein